MSGVATAVKKKMMVSADQFEDAEEEAEDFLGAAVKKEADEPEAPASKVKVEETSSGTEAEEEAPPPAEEVPVKTEDVVVKEMVEAEPVRPRSVSSASPKSETNPLDALALACVAKDQLKVNEPKPKGQPQPPADALRVKADDISCTDGESTNPSYGSVVERERRTDG